MTPAKKYKAVALDSDPTPVRAVVWPLWLKAGFSAMAWFNSACARVRMGASK